MEKVHRHVHHMACLCPEDDGHIQWGRPFIGSSKVHAWRHSTHGNCIRELCHAHGSACPKQHNPHKC
eukprot:1160653-Pelagomonas_calceolata.AAC.5